MATNTKISQEQMEQLKDTLRKSLGDSSGFEEVVKGLEDRFSKKESVKRERGGAAGDKTAINVKAIIQRKNPMAILDAISHVPIDSEQCEELVTALLKHGKAYHFLDALRRVKSNVALVEDLVRGIVSKKGVKAAIDALKLAGDSQDAVKLLAAEIADQGDVNQMIRAIGTAPPNQYAEILWTMEIISRGTLDQILETMALLSKDSPGMLVLATGIANRPDAEAPMLTRALGYAKENLEASNTLSIALARVVDVYALLSLLDKNVNDNSHAGEIIVSKLVEKGRVRQMVEGCKYIRSNSVAARILAVGITRKGKDQDLIKAYNLLRESSEARKILALEIVIQKGRFGALKALGKEAWDLTKNREDIEAFSRKARKRYEWILENEIHKESSEESEES